MLTNDQQNYLAKIDPRKSVHIYSFDPKGKNIGERITSRIRNVLPQVEVLFMGSVALGIAGQKDIDIYILSNKKNFAKYLPQLEKLFSKADKKVHDDFIEWNMREDGFELEVYLTEPPEEQIKVFEILKYNKQLLKEYENLKLKFQSKKLKDYTKAKYEFFNMILSLKTKQLNLGKHSSGSWS